MWDWIRRASDDDYATSFFLYCSANPLWELTTRMFWTLSGLRNVCKLAKTPLLRSAVPRCTLDLQNQPRSQKHINEKLKALWRRWCFETPPCVLRIWNLARDQINLCKRLTTCNWTSYADQTEHKQWVFRQTTNIRRAKLLIQSALHNIILHKTCKRCINCKYVSLIPSSHFCLYHTGTSPLVGCLVAIEFCTVPTPNPWDGLRYSCADNVSVKDTIFDAYVYGYSSPLHSMKQPAYILMLLFFGPLHPERAFATLIKHLGQHPRLEAEAKILLWDVVSELSLAPLCHESVFVCCCCIPLFILKPCIDTSQYFDNVSTFNFCMYITHITCIVLPLHILGLVFVSLSSSFTICVVETSSHWRVSSPSCQALICIKLRYCCGYTTDHRHSSVTFRGIRPLTEVQTLRLQID